MRVCHFLTNPYSFDNRVKKECEYLVNMGFDVFVVGMARGNEFPLRETINGVKVIRVPTHTHVFGALKMLIFQVIRAANSQGKRGGLMSKLFILLRWFHALLKKFSPATGNILRKVKRLLILIRNKFGGKAGAGLKLEDAIASEIALSTREKLEIIVTLFLGVLFSPLIIVLLFLRRILRAFKPLLHVFINYVKSFLIRVLRVAKPLRNVFISPAKHSRKAIVRRILYLEKAIELQADVYQANDWDTLGLTYITSKIVGSQYIYDAHELYDECFPKRKKLLRRAYFRATESFFSRRAMEVITVSHEIARVLKQRYSLKNSPVVVRNVQQEIETLNTEIDNKQISLFELINQSPREKRLIAYAGKITAGRGLEELVRSSVLMKDEATVIIMGPCEPAYKQYLLDLAEELGVLEHKVCILDPVPPADLPYALKDVFLGVVSTPTEILSYYYGLSNKMFSYIQAGVPIVSIDHPEKRRFIEANQVGVLIEDNTHLSIAEAVNDLIETPEQREQLHLNCLKAAKVTNWQNEVIAYESVFVRMYERVLFGEVVSDNIERECVTC